MKKYTLLTDEAVNLTYRVKGIDKSVRVFPIQALIDIPSKGIKKGDKGGHVETEDNLSHEGSCWVYPTCVVIEGAIVFGDASISQQTKLVANTQVSGHSIVKNSELHNSMVDGNTEVSDSKLVNTVIYKDGIVQGSTLLNLSIWHGNFINSKILFLKNTACFTSKETSHFRESILEHTGLRTVNTDQPLLVSHTTIRNLKTLRLESGLELHNVASLGSSHIVSKKNERHKLNRLMGQQRFLLQSKARVTLKDSQVKAEGYLIYGRTLFEDVTIDTLGEITKNTKTDLHLKNVTMTEFSSLSVDDSSKIFVQDVNISGDTVYKP